MTLIELLKGLFYAGKSPVPAAPSEIPDDAERRSTWSYSADNCERRSIVVPVELRAAKKAQSPGTLAGYAARFNMPSVDFGGWVEQIAPGAFRAVLEDDVCCLRNHEADQLLGRLRSGTLRLTEDAEGLAFECDLPDTQVGRDTAEMIRRGDMSGCSFSFRVAPDGDAWDWSGAVAKRTVHKFSRLYDVGPVTMPAYESTSVDCRSYQAAKADRDAKAQAVKDSIDLARARQRQAEAQLV